MTACESGALPLRPQDLSLCGHPSLVTAGASDPAPTLVWPRNRRSGSIPGEPYPPSGLDQFTPTGSETEENCLPKGIPVG
jgi:hypothetical protein